MAIHCLSSFESPVTVGRHGVSSRWVVVGSTTHREQRNVAAMALEAMKWMSWCDHTSDRFVAQEVHVAEYLLFDPETILKDFETARTADGDALTAEFVCDTSLATCASSPGSLSPLPECNAIKFMKSRPAVFNLPVPPAFVSSSSAQFERCGYEGCVCSV